MALGKVLDRADSTIYRDPAAYTSHPCVARLTSGDLLVAFNESLPRHPSLHPPSDPRFINLMCRSRDDGAHWLAPRAVPDYGATGTECPSITQLANGDVLLVQWRFAWYPLETARALARQPDSTVELVLPSTRSWLGRRPTSDADWDECELPWARGNAGLFVSLSSDNGATWERTTVVSTAPFARGYSPRPPCQLADGTLLLALGSHDEHGFVYILRSSDSGQSWEAPRVISDSPPLAEPTILALPSGKVVVLSRDEKTQLLHQHDSFDSGQTWAPPRPTCLWGYPAHLLRLADGRLFALYGVRRPPYGIRASLSVDNGASWDTGGELVIRDDMPNRNLGYPTAAELPDGSLLAVYYGEDADSVTHIMGSRFRLP